MKAIVNITGVIGLIPNESGQPIEPNTTFLDVVNQLEGVEGVTAVDVFINSPGGLVEEGDLIHNYLEGLKKKGIVINTFAEDECASAAVKLFLVGSQRLINSHTQFMIHNPFGQPAEGDADEIERYSKELRSLENDMASFYSSKTGTSKDALKPLMKQETFLTPDQAVSLGFATGKLERVPLNAVAFSQKLNSNLNTSKMAKETLDQKGAEKLVDTLIKGLKGILNGSKPKGLKVVLDAEAGEIEFPDLNPDDTPSVGDATTAEDGEYLLPSGETYVVADGTISDIKPAEGGDGDGDGDGDGEELAAANQRITELEAALETAKNLQEQAESDQKNLKKEMKSMKKGLKTLQRSIGSGFNHDGKAKNHKTGGDGKKSRQLFKADD